MLPAPRSARYSGSDRPAWRMNHTGTRSAGRLRQASRNGASAGDGIGGHATGAATGHPWHAGGDRRGESPVDRSPGRHHDGSMRTPDSDESPSGDAGSLADGFGAADLDEPGTDSTDGGGYSDAGATDGYGDSVSALEGSGEVDLSETEDLAPAD